MLANSLVKIENFRGGETPKSNDVNRPIPPSPSKGQQRQSGLLRIRASVQGWDGESLIGKDNATKQHEMHVYIYT